MTGAQFWALIAGIAAIIFCMYHIRRARLNAIAEYRRSKTFKAAILRLKEQHNIVVYTTNESPFDCKIVHPKGWEFQFCAKLVWCRRKKVFSCDLTYQAGTPFNVNDVHFVADIANELNQALAFSKIP